MSVTNNSVPSYIHTGFRKLDCAGRPFVEGWDRPFATPDMCGACDADPANDCRQDCLGRWGGGAGWMRCHAVMLLAWPTGGGSLLLLAPAWAVAVGVAMAAAWSAVRLSQRHARPQAVEPFVHAPLHFR
jgi:hypothetical protein